ncbi:hypothetical protein GCM10027515_12610 [Schumannella luteola]|uniref:Insulinase family protein n=1 Tax=Schumannella luteola TaxID=472059 RepID=A0A852Y8K0_9MICO|nr:insulinase family protein [Schumannella luteola]NYG97710.1 hypothetical protein [Schumannella luteola]TPX01423.1 insulinase family protein [Schumannella luteola]
MEITALKTAQGTVVVSVERESSPAVHAGLLIHHGSVDDPLGHHGLAHVREHVLTGMSARSDRLTAASTRRDTMIFAAERRTGLDAVASLSELTARCADAPNALIEEQRRVVLAELAHSRPTSTEAGFRHLFGTDSPYVRPPAGTPTDVSNLGYEDLRFVPEPEQASPPPVIVVLHSGSDRRHLIERLIGEGASGWLPPSAPPLERRPAEALHHEKPRPGRLAFDAYFTMPQALASPLPATLSAGLLSAAFSPELSDFQRHLDDCGVAIDELRFTAQSHWRARSLGHIQLRLTVDHEPRRVSDSFREAARRLASSAHHRANAWRAHGRTANLRSVSTPSGAIDFVQKNWTGEGSVEELVMPRPPIPEAFSDLISAVHVHGI